MVRMPFSWCTASNRSPEEQCSTPVPHHAAGGRLSLDGLPPGEQGSIPSQRSGSGMDPPVFWAGNTGKSQTTHSIIHARRRPGNPETRPFTTSRPNCLLLTRWIPAANTLAGRPLSKRRPAAYFRHKPRVRKRRSFSILRSTIVWSNSALRRRTSCRRSPQSQGRVAGGRVSSCS